MSLKVATASLMHQRKRHDPGFRARASRLIDSRGVDLCVCVLAPRVLHTPGVPFLVCER